MELIDTHCHLTFEQYDGILPQVLSRSRDAGVKKFITVGTDIQHSRKSAVLSEKFDDIYASVGIHPHYAKDATQEKIDEIKKLARNEKVVALGETGLDLHYNYSDESRQAEIFVEQLKIASELQLAVIVHSREAVRKTLNIIEDFEGDIPEIVFHCYTDTADSAREIIEKGFYISFTGVITFKSADSARQAVKAVPMDKMMLETDCPFMSPAPMRKQKINEPALMVHTLNKIAELKDIPAEEAAESLTANSRKFFGI
jgi:TatD DNase family protein